jgi:hemolysin activation/secretion protein
MTRLNMRDEFLIPRRWLSIVLAVAGMTGLHAWAQALPDAGSIRQQIEPSRALPLPPAVPPQRAAPPPEIKQSVGMTVNVKSFQLLGHRRLSTEELMPALAEFVGRTLDFAGLQRATDAVAAAYRESGWLARVYLPEQDISEGTITLQVVEARFAGLRLEGEPSKRVLSSDIQAFFEEQQKAGEPLNTLALDRALLLADDLPGISVAGTLVPGQAEGETGLAIQTGDEALFFGDVTLDNTGSRSTGSNRVMLNMNISSPGEHGELINLTALRTQGSAYVRLGLTVPVGYNGLRFGINGSTMNYKVIEGPSSLVSLNVQGSSDSIGLDWSFPVVRQRMRNLYFSGGLDNKRFYNDSINKTSDTNSYADYETNSLRLGFSGNVFDDLGGGGANSASLQVMRGQLDRVKAHTQIDTLGRDYIKFNYALSRQQSLTADHSLFLNLQGQHATELLDSSEKFYVGGASTVRAYPSSELGGERGQLLTGEWRWRLHAAWVLSGFMDQAWVTTLPTTAADPSTLLSLRGYGLSAAWQGPMGLNAKLTWSKREGENPKPTSTGTDGDGTLQINRIWFTVGLAF